MQSVERGRIFGPTSQYCEQAKYARGKDGSGSISTTPWRPSGHHVKPDCGDEDVVLLMLMLVSWKALTLSVGLEATVNKCISQKMRLVTFFLGRVQGGH